MAWFRHVSDAVYDAVAAALGLDPEQQSTLDRIVPAYVPGITTPQYNSDDDVVFYALSEETTQESSYVAVRGKSETLTDQHGAEQTVHKLAVTKIIPVSLLLTFYGPNSDDDSEKVWARLMVDNGAGSPRSILRANNIVLNYGLGRMPPRPVSVPELEGTLWRRRCDLRLSMSYLCTDELGMTPVEHVPEIEMKVAD